MSKSSFDAFLKKVKFEDIKNWYLFQKDQTTINHKINEFNNIDLFDIWQKFQDYEDLIKNKLDDETFELLKIYLSLNYDKVPNLKIENVLKIQESILSIKENLFKKLQNVPELNKLEKLNFNIIDNIRNKTLNLEELEQYIKVKIISLNDSKRIFYLMSKIEQERKKCLNFSKFMNLNSNIHNLKISDDGYSIENIDLSDEKYSNGQRIIYIFKILLDIFAKSGKTIILDDVFEKLDIQNSVELLDMIFDNYHKYNISIEILTHDEYFVDLFYKVLSDIDEINDTENVQQMRISIEDNKPILANDKTPINFKQYMKNVYDTINKNKTIDDDTKKHLLFIKLFDRNSWSNNYIQVLEKDNDFISEKNITLEIFKFLSEEIFHYENEIDIEKYPLIKNYFDYDLFKQHLNTIELYEKLIKIFSKSEKKYGICLKKVSSFLEKMIEYLKMEKDCFCKNFEQYEKNKKTELNEGKFYKKTTFYKEFLWDKNPSKKLERNKLFHSLELSLDSLKNNN